MSVHLVARARPQRHALGYRHVAVLALVALLGVALALVIAVALWPAAGNEDLLLAPFRWSQAKVAV